MRRRARQRNGDAVAAEGVAGIVHRLAVMLAAGVAPGNAWLYLAPVPPDGDLADPGPSSVVSAVADAIDRGVSIPSAILAGSRSTPRRTRESWRAVGAAWYAATESGAPLASALRDLADTLRQLGQLHRDVDAALAGPVATARFVALMPVVGLGLGLLLGFDTVGILCTTPLGLGCLVCGILLSVVAARWTAFLVSRARPAELTPGLSAQLVSIGLAGGGPVDRAQALAEDARGRFGLGPDPDSGAVQQALALSRRAGVPVADLLRSEAEQLRREATSAAQTRAARLGVTLMIPLGVCVLPAFMLLGVAPLMLSVLSSTMTGFAG